MTGWLPRCIRKFSASTSPDFSGCSAVFLRAALPSSPPAWLLIWKQPCDYGYPGFFWLSWVARRGCPCFTNQLCVGKAASSTAKCPCELCRAEAGLGWQHQGGNCSGAAGKWMWKWPGVWGQHKKSSGKGFLGCSRTCEILVSALPMILTLCLAQKSWNHRMVWAGKDL